MKGSAASDQWMIEWNAELEWIAKRMRDVTASGLRKREYGLEMPCFRQVIGVDR